MLAEHFHAGMRYLTGHGEHIRIVGQLYKCPLLIHISFCCLYDYLARYESNFFADIGCTPRHDLLVQYERPLHNLTRKWDAGGFIS